MSARRARIKAVVTSFPARRKLSDVVDNTKAKIPEKETIEKPIRAQGGSPLKSPSSINDVNKYQAETVPSPLALTEVIKEVAFTPKRSEEVSDNTSISSVTPEVFVSPRNVGSPLGSHVGSPLVHSSEVEVNVQKLTPVTPKKISEKPKQESVESRRVQVDVTDGKSKETMKSVINTVPSDVSDDYNVATASLPDSTIEDNIMDGIVPLQAVSRGPTPIALLKNEIISENAEVLFDPIMPLPAPIKARPKLRPVPRLAPLRRSIVQANVSEADDESRRALLSGCGASTSAAPRQGHDSHDPSHSTLHSLPNREVKRIKNESVSSSVSQATPQPPPADSSPIKEKHLSKCRRVDMPRRMPAMRRLREAGKKDTLTMYDLIFTNPSSNPIVSDEAQTANEKEEAARKAAIEQEKGKEDQTEMETDVAPVPQIKLGPDGEIMLDEKSLVIKQSEKRKVSSSIVHEGASGSTSCGYRRRKRTALWTDAETVQFYRALASLGTDFMLMENLFPGRTRRDLKLKFKREERVHMAQVEKALRSTSKWDATRLENEFRAEREEAEKAAQELRQRAIDMNRQKKEARRQRLRLSLAAKTLGASALPSYTSCSADELILQHFEAKTQESTASSQAATTARVMPKSKSNDMATISKKDTKSQGKSPPAPAVKQPPKTPKLPSNVEEGSIVVFTIEDPDSPPNRKLQTYMARAGGRLSPVTLPTKFLKTITTYMKTGVIPNNTSVGSAASPSSAASLDSRPCPTDPAPAVI